MGEEGHVLRFEDALIVLVVSAFVEGESASFVGCDGRPSNGMINGHAETPSAARCSSTRPSLLTSSGRTTTSLRANFRRLPPTLILPTLMATDLATSSNTL